MKITLSNGMVTEIDNTDHHLVENYSWHAKIDPKTSYAVCHRNGRKISMHRLILGLTDPKIKTDHKDLNGLNNKRSNLRQATQSQNMANAGLLKNNTSGARGVHFRKRGNYEFWRAEITVRGKRIILGVRKDKEAAVRLYDEAAIKYFGEFARPNIPKNEPRYKVGVP